MTDLSSEPNLDRNAMADMAGELMQAKMDEARKGANNTHILHVGSFHMEIVPNKDIPLQLIESCKKTCVVGLICDATRLSDVRRNRVQSMHEDRPGNYTNEEEILDELENSKKSFKKYNWPIIDVTRKSVEETAASIIKILDILNSK